MAKLSGLLKGAQRFGRKTAKAAKIFGNSRVGKALTGVAQGPKGRKSLSTVRSQMPLASVPQMLQPPEQPAIGGGVKNLPKLIDSKIQQAIPRIKQAVQPEQQQFNPQGFLSSIFSGGLNSLNQFSGSLGGLRSSLQSTIGFLSEAKGIVVDLINKMAKAKTAKPRGGFFKGLITNIAKIGLMAMTMKAAPAALAAAAPMLGKVALGAAVVGGAGFIANKVLGRKRNDKVKSNDEIDGKRFNQLVEDMASSLRILEKKTRKKQDDNEEEQQEENKEDTKSDVDGVEQVDEPPKVEDTGGETTEQKSEVKPQETVTGQPNAILKTDESGAMTITPTQAKIEHLEGKIAEERKELEKFETGERKGSKKKEFIKKKIGLFEDIIEDLQLKAQKGDTGADGLRGEQGGSNVTQNVGKTFKFDASAFRKSLEDPAGNIVINATETSSGGLKEEEDSEVSGGDSGTSEVTAAETTDTSTIEGDTGNADAMSEIATDISQPATGVVDEGGGSGQVTTMPLPTDSKQGNKPITRNKTKMNNELPMIPAMRLDDIHIQHAKAVFNIVDAM
tara:strand:+ start:1976 stop:3658 length:1683 start_codon:yes stop_codon:yes gene_type:complete